MGLGGGRLAEDGGPQSAHANRGRVTWPMVAKPKLAVDARLQQRPDAPAAAVSDR